MTSFGCWTLFGKIAILAFIGLSFLCHSSHALGPNDEANCCVHPDPHFISFHGIGYDYQHGCDVVLVNNPNIKIHLRLVKFMGMPGTAFSFIDTIGIEIPIGGGAGSTDIFEATINGMYYLNGCPHSVTSSFIPVTHLGGGLLPFSIVPLPSGAYQYVIELPTPLTGSYPPGYFKIAIDDWTMVGSGITQQGFGLSLCITGHGSYFQGSEGMCGEWDASPSLSDRAGTNMIVSPGLPFVYTGPVYDGSLFGDEWQVGLGPLDGPFVSILTTTGGHGLFPVSCVARRRDLLEISDGNDSGEMMNESTAVALYSEYDEEEEQEKASLRRDLQRVKCTWCKQFANPIQRANCEYDATVYSCDVVQYFPFYNEEETMYYNQEMEPQLCKTGLKEGEWKTPPCEKLGGMCVRFCDIRNPNYKCKLGLCTHKRKETNYDFGLKGLPILLYNRFYYGCACMIKKKKSEE